MSDSVYMYMAIAPFKMFTYLPVAPYKMDGENKYFLVKLNQNGTINQQSPILYDAEENKINVAEGSIE